MKKLIAFIILLIPFIYSGMAFSQPSIGQEAPKLTGLKMVGRELPDLGGKFVFVDFWATWCKPCRESMPRLNTLAEKYKDRVVFLTISDEKEEVLRNFIQKSSCNNLLYSMDINGECNASYSIKAFPTYFLISPDNTILATGVSSVLSDNYLDSLINNYSADNNIKKTQTVVLRDNVSKESSIEISCKPGSKKQLKTGAYSFVVVDSLKIVLPYMAGVKCANRTRWENIPKEMVEVKIFSRHTPTDSLKKLAYNLLTASFGIHTKSATECTNVFRFVLKDSKLLTDKNTIIEPGAAKSMNFLNACTLGFDNYSLNEIVSFLEGVYFPKILYADTALTGEYDWKLSIIDPDTRQWVSFDRLKELLLKDFGIDVKEEQRNETYTVYYK